MPAFSLKALLTHLYGNCTTSSSSHARAFSRAEVVRAIPESNHRRPRRRSKTPKLDGFISVRIGEPCRGLTHHSSVPRADHVADSTLVGGSTARSASPY